MARSIVATVAVAVAALAGCSLLGGGAEPDPTAGWGGTWRGSYYGVGGNSGSIELEIAADTTGVPVGVARFDSDGGRNRARLLDLRLTADSLHASLVFDGLSAELSGAREGDTAEGSYAVRPADGEGTIDSGSWRVERSPAGPN